MGGMTRPRYSPGKNSRTRRSSPLITEYRMAALLALVMALSLAAACSPLLGSKWLLPPGVTLPNQPGFSSPLWTM